MQLETRPKLGPSGASQRARPLRSFKQFATSSIKMRNVGSSRCQAQPGAEEKPSTAGKTPYVVAKPTAEELQDYEHPMDVEEFRRLGHQVVDWVADYYAGLKAGKVTRVRPGVQPGYLRPLLPSSAPEKPDAWEQVMADFNEKLMPGVTHWQAPKFFAWFPANSSFPGLLADMLGGALNMIGFSWAASPVSTELEMVMMDWLVELLGLPAHWKHSTGGPGGGSIQGTASEALLVALLAARAKALKGRPPEDAVKLVAYSSDQAHSCFKKACMIAGVTHMRVLKAQPEHDYALQPSELQAAMQADLDAGLLPFFVTATIGTTSSCAVDPIAALAEVAHTHGCCPDAAPSSSNGHSNGSANGHSSNGHSGSNGSSKAGRAWMHVDAAYAGSAAVCPELRAQHFGGLEAVDSYAFNPHKWMLTNFDCCALWAADAGPVKDALSLTPIFLRGAGNALDFKDWQIPLGRRFRSLKLFFVLRLYGAEALRQYIRHHCALAAWFASQVASDLRLELAAPPRFGLVCFRLAGVPNSVNEAFLNKLHENGDLALTQTELAGRYTIRLAVGAASTQLEHVQEAWQVVQAAATEVLAAHAATSTAAVAGQAKQ